MNTVLALGLLVLTGYLAGLAVNKFEIGGELKWRTIKAHRNEIIGPMLTIRSLRNAGEIPS